MSEFSLASTTAKKKTHLSSLLLSDFMLFCSFVLSHPLYFSYFIFFSPYLYKIFSFLSPLFVTTTLLLLAFFTLTPSFVNQAGSCHLELPESKVSFLLTTYQTLVETLRSKTDDESDGFACLEELEAYKIMFETSTALEIRESPDQVLELESKEDCLQAVEAPVDKGSSRESKSLGVPETLTSSILDEKSAEIARPETNQVMAVVKIFEDFLQEKEGVENLSSKKREKEAKSQGVESNKGEEQKEEEFMRSGSKAILGNKISDPKVRADNGGEHAAKAMLNSKRVIANCSTENDGDNASSIVTDNNKTMGSSLGNFGSMRKEKEWKRTLACKLFEERHNVDGGEGMDLLWETYETDSNKVQLKSSSKKGKKGGNEYYDDEDDYEEDSDGQLCCLQALKFSAGKMNLGMGRPNLVKISKALKGIGWLHHVSSRHGKKGYH
ncbi:uncharacterized protein LOC110409270 [Herrania umbratica]|uniref:Uncharacterized protein LOC110409270 n=1 Tax=Herrania umbratica TaxID=108875 RepID=A0A6J0ZH42_9ROSI|nr:uncharacterized protein LOC110409270 [Herrania umbratica]